MIRIRIAFRLNNIIIVGVFIQIVLVQILENMLPVVTLSDRVGLRKGAVHDVIITGRAGGADRRRNSPCNRCIVAIHRRRVVLKHLSRGLCRIQRKRFRCDGLRNLQGCRAIGCRRRSLAAALVHGHGFDIGSTPSGNQYI